MVKVGYFWGGSFRGGPARIPLKQGIYAPLGRKLPEALMVSWSRCGAGSTATEHEKSVIPKSSTQKVWPKKYIKIHHQYMILITKKITKSSTTKKLAKNVVQMNCAHPSCFRPFKSLQQKKVLSPLGCSPKTHSILLHKVPNWRKKNNKKNTKKNALKRHGQKKKRHLKNRG